MDYWSTLSSYGAVHGIKMPSLEEFLAPTSSDGSQEESEFDDEMNKKLDQYAVEQMKRKREALGK